MARHDTPAIYFKAFILLAMFPAVEHYILVFVADKKVYPCPPTGRQFTTAKLTK
jgi:hypothetical protein